MLVFRDSLFTLGSLNNTGSLAQSIHVSADGQVWKPRKQIDSMPIHVRNAVVFKDRIWVIGVRPGSEGSLGDSSRNTTIWSSDDGAAWKEEMPTTPFGNRVDFGFIAYRESLWVFAGPSYDQLGTSDTWSSGDGRTWSSMESDANPMGSTASLAGFADAFFMVGGRDGIDGASNPFYRHSSDGARWIQSTSPPGLLPRWGNTVTQHEGKLWIIGGRQDSVEDSHLRKYLNDVWSSIDGLKWKLENGHAPFSGRTEHRTVSFKGRLWVMGGRTATNAGLAKDLGYLEP